MLNLGTPVATRRWRLGESGLVAGRETLAKAVPPPAVVAAVVSGMGLAAAAQTAHLVRSPVVFGKVFPGETARLASTVAVAAAAVAQEDATQATTNVAAVAAAAARVAVVQLRWVWVRRRAAEALVYSA